jgi:hypothetical protein
MSIGTLINVEPPAMRIAGFFAAKTALSGPDTRAVGTAQISRLNFASWMDAEAARCAYPSEGEELIRIRLTRKALVERVANALRGSHALEELAASTRQDDRAIARMLGSRAGNLSLPYFVLLKIAQDVIAAGGRFLVPTS